MLALIIISGCAEVGGISLGEINIFTCRVSYCNVHNQTFHSMEVSYSTLPYQSFCVCVSDDGLERKYKYERPQGTQDFIDEAREKLR